MRAFFPAQSAAHRRVPPFTPLDLGAKLKLWDDERGQPVAAGKITDWLDQSPAGHNFGTVDSKRAGDLIDAFATFEHIWRNTTSPPDPAVNGAWDDTVGAVTLHNNGNPATLGLETSPEYL